MERDVAWTKAVLDMPLPSAFWSLGNEPEGYFEEATLMAGHRGRGLSFLQRILFKRMSAASCRVRRVQGGLHSWKQSPRAPELLDGWPRTVPFAQRRSGPLKSKPKLSIEDVTPDWN